MNRTRILLTLALTFIIHNSRLHGDWIDRIAQAITGNGWHIEKIEEVMHEEIDNNRHAINKLKEQRKNADDLTCRSILATDIQAQKNAKKQHLKALHALKLISNHKEQLQEIIKLMRNICASNAEVKILEDKDDSASLQEALKLRTAIMQQKARIKEKLELY